MSLGFTVGARVFCPGYKLHVTLAYVGECGADRIAQITEAVKARAKHPILLELGDADMFGPPEKRDIPVVLCNFVDPKVAALWQSFYDEFGLLSPGQPGTKLPKLNYHISVKKPGSEEVLCSTSWVSCHYVFLERIGPGQEPIFRAVLPRVGLHVEPVPGCKGEHPRCPCSDCEEFHWK